MTTFMRLCYILVPPCLLLSCFGATRKRRLSAASGKPFVGDASSNFVEYIRTAEVDAREKHFYAKAVSVVQSSGTGKSRMLTEVGKFLFTLPICLRHKNGPGWPRGDDAVVDYFAPLQEQKFPARGVACFLAAAHWTMLRYLQSAQEKNQFDRPKLLDYWHNLMEPNGDQSADYGGRSKFFEEVVKLAYTMESAMSVEVPDESDPTKEASKLYNDKVKEATMNLMNFLSKDSPDDVAVMYFDEAHRLEELFWVLLRLLHHQQSSTKMWYTFMGTYFRLSYDAPCPADMRSLRLRDRKEELTRPFTALGFDQQMVAKNQTREAVSMGDLQKIEHLSQYGRPMWSAQLPEESEDELVEIAGLKLTIAEPFRTYDKYHIFAVLSARLCLDIVPAGSRAFQFAECSVAKHMRLLIGFLGHGEVMCTHSPSEPILALGAARLLYNSSGHFADALHTLSSQLCSMGLVEKGALGELAARTLLLIARDYKDSLDARWKELLSPLPLLHFLRNLFGDDEWLGREQANFRGAFRDAYVNSTHWIVTKDRMPEELHPYSIARKFVGSGCSTSMLFPSNVYLIPVYSGSISENALFDPSCLSVVVGQVNFKDAGDKKAGSKIRPIEIPRDFLRPLPYLALLMELGNEDRYNGHTKILPQAFEPADSIPFPQLVEELDAARKNLGRSLESTEAEKNFVEKQQAMDAYNRYSVSVRGATADTYGILRVVRIEDEFASLLNMSKPDNEARAIQHMLPFEQLALDSHHTDWMSEYYVKEDVVMEVDE